MPPDALLERYMLAANYTDCYQTEIGGRITLASFVNAFYTSWLFKLERMILQWTLSRPSTDAQAMQLATGELDHFAAWQVEDRADQQILLSDLTGRTRTWLMVIPGDHGKNATTRLCLGSAVTALPALATGSILQWLGFSLLLRFHRLYSVMLLYTAKQKLMQN